MWRCAVRSRGRRIAHTGADFAASARPLWFVFVAIGVVITVLGFFSTTPRAFQSAERLAPLIAGTAAPKVGVHAG